MNIQTGKDKEDSDGEDQDESLSSQDVGQALCTFRENWHRQLTSPHRNQDLEEKKDTEISTEDQDFETKAKILFLQGVEMEKSGKLYEAIQFYRRAVQLVPDIEFKLDHSKAKTVNRPSSETESEEEKENSYNSEDEEIKDGELLPSIQRKMAGVSAICMPKTQQWTSHISILPFEMILYILRWVVSSDLDLRSLEMFSMVCRGFYLCARDSEIWHLACMRVWGLNCGNAPAKYPSWREMFIERNRLLFDGCYIGKTTYVRHGENSFQDQFYRPWHLVTYYRYLRFFPEGIVLVLTSSDEPAQCVSQLKYRTNTKHPILKGYYRLKDDKVILVVQRQDPKGFKRGKWRDNLHETTEQTFHMELQIKNRRQKRHVQLVWSHYSIFTRTRKGDESTCNFDIVPTRFPPFWFSRVKSYCLESDNVLM